MGCAIGRTSRSVGDPSSTSPTNNNMAASSFPSLNSPQRAGSLRNKVSLKPGRSLMDWIRLGNSGEDIQGFGGKFQKVSSEELARHNTEGDVWISLRGRVYNITSYLEYHPGGVPEIMRGAGIDATHLFNEIHQWVNAESMLQKCLIGPLIHSPKEKKKQGSAKVPVSLSLLAPPSPAPVRLDDISENEDTGIMYWDCIVKSVSDVTHNVKLFCFELPEGVFMDVPIGHHIHLKRTISGMEISRPYTVVVPSLNSSHQEQDKTHLFLMIKIYPSGTLTPSLLQLNVEDRCFLNGYSGNFKVSRLKEAKDICMIAGGTGLTPMVRIINLFTQGELSSLRSLTLIFANREEQDIIWKKQLDQLMKEHDRFQVFYFLSNPLDSWSGHTGRITEASLQDLLPVCPPSGSERDLLICVCGPDPFTLQQLKHLKHLGYQSKSSHAFFG